MRIAFPKSSPTVRRLQMMPALALAAEKYGDTLEDGDDEFRFAGACEEVEALSSGTPTIPESKSEGGELRF